MFYFKTTTNTEPHQRTPRNIYMRGFVDIMLMLNSVLITLQRDNYSTAAQINIPSNFWVNEVLSYITGDGHANWSIFITSARCGIREKISRSLAEETTIKFLSICYEWRMFFCGKICLILPLYAKQINFLNINRFIEPFYLFIFG